MMLYFFISLVMKKILILDHILSDLSHLHIRSSAHLQVHLVERHDMGLAEYYKKYIHQNPISIQGGNSIGFIRLRKGPQNRP